MCARMRKVRLLVLPGALLVKVSLSLGDTFGERTFGRKKRYSSIQRRGLKTLTKGLAFIPRDIFFLNIITHDERRRRRRRRRRSSSVFFRAGGAFFMINMSFWFGRDTKRRVLVCLLLRKKKGPPVCIIIWAFSISFVDTQQ